MRSIRMFHCFPVLCLAVLAGRADSSAAQSPVGPASALTGSASSTPDSDRPSDTGAKRSAPALANGILAPTVKLSADPTTVNSGGSTRLTWSSTNATSCTAAGGWTGTKATSGSQTIGNLTSTTTFSLQCQRRNRVSAVRSVTVTVNAAPTPTATLSANPTLVDSGGSTQLTWSSTNATSCTASGGWSGSKPVSGSQTIGDLAVTTTFSLTCSGAGGSSPAQNVTVTVTGTGTAASFPRLGGMLIGNPHNFEDPVYQSQIARLDLAVRANSSRPEIRIG